MMFKLEVGSIQFHAIETKMEVTRENFETVLATLPEVIQNAQFLAFDTEFTGVKVEGAANINYFDTLEDLYLKDRLIAETFMAIQFGLVAFIYDEKTNKYTHQGYNFYIYPSSYSNINFTCQNKSIEFLVEHGFDFNKLFTNGIPYLKDMEAEKLIEKLEEKFKKNNRFENSCKIKVPPEQEETVNDIINKIQSILKSNVKENFTTKKYNSFVRRLIYNSVQHKFGSKVLLTSNKDETMTITVGLNSEEIKKLQENNFLLQKSLLLKEFGFNKVIKMLLESKKLLIGHNLFLDLLFTIRQFLTPLPDTYQEFKELTSFLFPKILDTKYMASTSEFSSIKDTSLNNVVTHFENLKEIPEVKINENGSGYNFSDNKTHEAAYDAYLTGLCFLAMLKHLGNINCEPNILSKLTESSCLQPIINKLSVPRLCNISCINIGDNDPEPDRDGVYHLTFPQEWNREDIQELFKDYGFVNISYLNSTSAYVQVKKEYIKEIKTNLIKENTNYKICTFTDFKTSNRNSASLLLSPLMEKRLGNSIKNFKINCDTSFSGDSKEMPKLLNKKRQAEEDIGEVIERSQKKKRSST